jgi:hypothetical protein
MRGAPRASPGQAQVRFATRESGSTSRTFNTHAKACPRRRSAASPSSAAAPSAPSQRSSFQNTSPKSLSTNSDQVHAPFPAKADSRADPRIPENKAALPNKSINLALSDRGITALQGVSEGLAAEVVGQTIPMRGRCLHDRKGNQVTQFYDVYGRV